MVELDGQKSVELPTTKETINNGADALIIVTTAETKRSIKTASSKASRLLFLSSERLKGS